MRYIENLYFYPRKKNDWTMKNIYCSNKDYTYIILYLRVIRSASGKFMVPYFLQHNRCFVITTQKLDIKYY